MTQHRSGAVRSSEAREAILSATADAFLSRGYEHLTMEGIAHAAGVGKQTIYRWWPNRVSLVAECLLEGRIFGNRLVPPDTGDLHRDLTTWLTDVVAATRVPGNHDLLRSLILAAAEDSVVGERLLGILAADGSLMDRLAAAQAAGELPADAPLEAISEAALGAIIFRTLSRRELADDAVARIVDVTISGAVGPRGRS